MEKRMQPQLFNDSFQNYKSYQIPKAQLILTDVPYALGDKAYASSPSWYVDGDNKNGESDKAKRGSGDIYVSINENDEVNVFVVHSTCEEDVDTRLTNIIEAVKGVVPTWDEIVEQCKEDAIWADEWQRNGFRNAADYYHYRYANW